MIPTPNWRFSETPAETTRLRNDVEVRTYEKRSIPIGARDFDGGALVPTSALAASVTDWERMARACYERPDLSAPAAGPSSRVQNYHSGRR